MNKQIYILSIVFIILGFVFQTALQEKINIFQWYDEIIAIIFFMHFIINILTGKLTKIGKYEFYCFLLMISLILVGLISNFNAKIETGWKTICIDIIANTKIFMIYLGILSFKNIDKYKNKIIKCTNFFVRKIVYIATVLCVVNYFYDINMASETRFGIKCFNFIFGAPGNFNMVCYYLMLLLTIGLNDKRNKIPLFCTLFLWASTLRTRAFLYVLLYIYIYFIMIKMTKISKETKNRIKPLVVLISIVIIVFGSYVIINEQVEYYFFNPRMPRAILLKYGIITMKDYFPLGTGFSTYGSSEAGKNYSPLYYKYGFNEGYGISYNNRMYLLDNYWPSIMGQFGAIGLAIVILLIINLIKSIIKRNKNDKYNLLGCIMILICILSASFVTSSMVHFTTVGLFFIIGLVSEKLKNNKFKEE